MNLEDYIKDLAPNLQEKARACGSSNVTYDWLVYEFICHDCGNRWI